MLNLKAKLALIYHNPATHPTPRGKVYFINFPINIDQVTFRNIVGPKLEHNLTFFLQMEDDLLLSSLP